jgi:hypothetical protein
MPRTVNADLRISREFKIRESWKLILSGDAFNLFNHLNVTGVSTQMLSITAPTTATTVHGVTCSATAPCLVFQDPAITGNPSTSLFHAATQSSNSLIAQRQIQIGARLTW